MLLFGPPNVPRLAAKRDADGLIKALRYRNDVAIQVASSRALGELGDPRAVDPLLAILDDKASPALAAATEALGRLGDPRAVDPLIQALATGTSGAAIRDATAGV